MKDYLNIGSVPVEEPCAQVGSSSYDYTRLSSIECKVFRDQLERCFPDFADNHCYFTIKSFQHDFGSYKEVCVVYNDELDISCEFAYNVEANTPYVWDAVAKGQLLNAGYNLQSGQS